MVLVDDARPQADDLARLWVKQIDDREAIEAKLRKAEDEIIVADGIGWEVWGVIGYLI